MPFTKSLRLNKLETKLGSPCKVKINLQFLHKARSPEKATFSVGKEKNSFTEGNSRNACLAFDSG